MSDKVVEIMARGIYQNWHGEHQHKPWDSLRVMHQMQWTGHASAALTALTEAGYAVVPVEPTEAMKRAGATSVLTDLQGCRPATIRAAAEDAIDVYRAMIAAAKEDGK